MNDSYDLVVIGLGAMGSATLYQAAKQGLRVLGIDSYHPPHSMGSSHGSNRITRLAIGEGEKYVPLVKRSHEIWRELEKQGEKILHQCGGLIIAPSGNDFLETTQQAAQNFEIDYETLTASEIGDRFPIFTPSSDMSGFFEPSAGYLIPEAAISAQLSAAKTLGAEVLPGTKVESWRASPGSPEIRTSKESFRAKKLIISAGAWVRELVAETRSILTIYEQMLYWFPIDTGAELFADAPIFIWEWKTRSGEILDFYGFPAIDGHNGGVKVATQLYRDSIEPGKGSRQATVREVEEMYETYIRPHLRGLGNKPLRSRSCLYTTAEDSRFLIDWHPSHSNVLVVSPCSGHGFKHSAAIGELAIAMATDEEPLIDPEPFSWARAKETK